MEILIRSFDWENLSKMGRFYGLTGRLGEMKRNGRSSRRTGRVSRSVLDSELKLHLLISILNIVKEKLIKKTAWQWQEQVSCNRRTIIILHIRKKIISVLLWQDHCVIVCCTTHARAHIVEEDWFFYLILINYPATKLSNVSICFIKVF